METRLPPGLSKSSRVVSWGYVVLEGIALGVLYLQYMKAWIFLADVLASGVIWFLAYRSAKRLGYSNQKKALQVARWIPLILVVAAIVALFRHVDLALRICAWLYSYGALMHLRRIFAPVLYREAVRKVAP